MWTEEELELRSRCRWVRMSKSSFEYVQVEILAEPLVFFEKQLEFLVKS
jgi:hypothetical protein